MFFAETHIRDNHVSGGPELARLTGASWPVPGGARVRFARTPAGGGGAVTADAGPPVTDGRGEGGAIA